MLFGSRKCLNKFFLDDRSERSRGLLLRMYDGTRVPEIDSGIYLRLGWIRSPPLVVPQKHTLCGRVGARFAATPAGSPAANRAPCAHTRTIVLRTIIPPILAPCQWFLERCFDLIYLTHLVHLVQLAHLAHLTHLAHLVQLVQLLKYVKTETAKSYGTRREVGANTSLLFEVGERHVDPECDRTVRYRAIHQQTDSVFLPIQAETEWNLTGKEWQLITHFRKTEGEDAKDMAHGAVKTLTGIRSKGKK